MFEQALKVTREISVGDRDALIARLDRVRTNSHNLGYEVGDAMASLLSITSAPDHPRQRAHSRTDMHRTLAENSRTIVKPQPPARLPILRNFQPFAESNSSILFASSILRQVASVGPQGIRPQHLP